LVDKGRDRPELVAADNPRRLSPGAGHARYFKSSEMPFGYAVNAASLSGDDAASLSKI